MLKYSGVVGSDFALTENKGTGEHRSDLYCENLMSG